MTTGVFARIAGIVPQLVGFLHFGSPANPGIRYDGSTGALETRNATDTGFARHSGADPVNPEDFVTLAYLNAHPAGGVVQAIDFAIGTVTVDSVSSLPAGSVVLRADVTITVPYSGGATIQVGQAGFPAAFQDSPDNVPTAAGEYTALQRTPSPAAPNPVEVTIGGAPGAGAGFVTVLFTIPLP